VPSSTGIAANMTVLLVAGTPLLMLSSQCPNANATSQPR